MRTLLLLSLIGYTITATAQFSDTVHHYIKYAPSGIINKTESGDSYVLNNALTYTLHKKKMSVNTAATWIYGEQDNNLTNNDFSAFSDIDYLKDIQKFYYWAMVGYDAIYSLKVNHRLQAGGGVGYTFLNKPTVNLVVSDGLVYENADLIDDKIGQDKYNTVRNSFRVKYKWQIGSILILDGSDFVQPSLSSFKDYVLRFTNNLSFKLKEWLKLTASMNYNKINRTGRENLLFTYGATFEKYF